MGSAASWGRRWGRHAAAALIAVGLVIGSSAALAQDDLTRALARMSTGGPEERAQAADEMGRRGNRRRDAVVPILRRHLRQDEDWRVRASSGRALGRLAARDAVPDLVAALRDSVVDVRVVAAAALWRLPDPAAVPALLELLRDRDASARQWACLALGVIHDRRATRPLITLLDDPEADVRLDAIRALGRLRDPSAGSALEGHVRDEARGDAERLEAIDALAALDGPEKVNALVRILRHDDADLRRRAASALGRVGDALVVPALRDRRRVERVGGVRSAIDAALREIEQRGQGGSAGGAGAPLNLPPLP